jgi:hypothetical protein
MECGVHSSIAPLFRWDHYVFSDLFQIRDYRCEKGSFSMFASCVKSSQCQEGTGCIPFSQMRLSLQSGLGFENFTRCFQFFKWISWLFILNPLCIRGESFHSSIAPLFRSDHYVISDLFQIRDYRCEKGSFSMFASCVKSSHHDFLSSCESGINAGIGSWKALI